MWKLIVPLIAATAVSSCQSFQSRYVDLSSDDIPQGLQYALPTALMTVELQQNGGKLWLGVSRPFLVGDPRATYTLSASAGLLSDQRYKLHVDPQTRLLDYINSVSEGQATRILQNIAGAAGASYGGRGFNENSLEDADAGAAVQVFSKVFDPMAGEACDFGQTCELKDLAAELNAKAREFLQCDKGANSPHYDRCKGFTPANNPFAITLEPVFKLDSRPSKQRARSAAAVCASSICYRAPAPYLMHVYVKGSRDVSEIVMLPNKGPILSLDLPSGIFAASRSRVELVYGMPARIEVDQGNELVGITAIPLTIMRSFFDAVSEVFQLQIKFNNEYADTLDSRLARQAKQDEYDQAQRDRAGASDGGSRNSSSRDSGGDDSGLAPESSLGFLEDEGTAIDNASRLNLTVVSEPENLLFTVPLQPEELTRRGGGGAQGVLDDTDSDTGHDLGGQPQ